MSLTAISRPHWRRIVRGGSSARRHDPARLAIAAAMPLGALALQGALWPWLKPDGWLLFYPAVFLAAQIGALAGALSAAAVSIVLVWAFFAAPPTTWGGQTPGLIASAGVFLLASALFGRVRQVAALGEAKLRNVAQALERRAAKGAAELQAANRELEAFSYSVSHDLRAPLRAIDGFSRILEHDYGGQFDESGQDYLARIRRSARRMGELIDDLLNLTRIGRVDLKRTEIDLSALGEVIAGALRATSPERDAQFHIARGMTARADPRLLRIALDNLLGNAWKFSAGRALARIEFDRREIDGVVTYRIRDNGAGFDMAYADKLFGAFQRLHGANEFPGSGIGLAIAHRIITRHGGRIWAEARPDEGATFSFTLEGSAADASR